MAASHETRSDLRTKSDTSQLHPNTPISGTKHSTHKSNEGIKTDTSKSKSDSHLRSMS